MTVPYDPEKDPGYIARRDEARKRWAEFENLMASQKSRLKHIDELLTKTHRRLALYEPYEFYADNIKSSFRVHDTIPRPAPGKEDRAYCQELLVSCRQRDAALKHVESRLTAFDRWAEGLEKRAPDDMRYHEVSLQLWQVSAVWEAYARYLVADNELARHRASRGLGMV
jgi:hypothetical protein